MSVTCVAKARVKPPQEVTGMAAWENVRESGEVREEHVEMLG
jgi:hypothetical protein